MSQTVTVAGGGGSFPGGGTSRPAEAGGGRRRMLFLQGPAFSFSLSLPLYPTPTPPGLWEGFLMFLASSGFCLWREAFFFPGPCLPATGAGQPRTAQGGRGWKREETCLPRPKPPRLRQFRSLPWAGLSSMPKLPSLWSGENVPPSLSQELLPFSCTPGFKIKKHLLR